MLEPSLVLASGSAIRAKILDGAGVRFRILKPDVDEATIKADMVGADLETVAHALADAKALAVDAPGAFVLGSDQILEYRGELFDKPRSRADAKARLLTMQGEAHTLINAVSIAKDGDVLFRNLDRPRLHMRSMSEVEIDGYLEAAGDEVLASVGAYQVEALGAHLFERIDGDYFAVLGLSLFPVLGFLRAQGIGRF